MKCPFFEAQEYLGIIVLCSDFFLSGGEFLGQCKAATTRHTALYEEELVDTRQVEVWRQVARTDGLPDCLFRQQTSQADGWAVVSFRIPFPLIFTFTEDLLVSNYHRRLHHSGGFGFLVTM